MIEEINRVKALFPDNVEKIIISKDDYDRLTGDLTLENIELKQEIERLRLELSGYRQAILQDKEMLGLKQENERLQDRINKAIETLKDEGLVVAIKIINEKNDEILLSSKDLLIDILKGSDKE